VKRETGFLFTLLNSCSYLSIIYHKNNFICEKPVTLRALFSRKAVAIRDKNSVVSQRDILLTSDLFWKLESSFPLRKKV